jgi:signal transduction histidine kinase
MPTPKTSLRSRAPRLAAALLVAACCACSAGAPKPAARTQAAAQPYEYAETRALVALVSDAAQRIERDGEAAFAELRAPGSRWRQGESYVFVLDPAGTMLVHPDPALEGKHELDLEDVHGRPIIRGLLHAATARPEDPEGWYHYEWPVPGGILPRWKSSYVRLVAAPSGQRFVVGGGMYDDRMERAFVVDMVEAAVAQIQTRGEAAFPLLRDRSGPFMAKDAYVFVIDPRGVDLVNPAFPNLEGRSLLDVRDTQGRPLIREMLDVARTRGAGWVDYMWPRPGESLSTRKSTYVARAEVGGGWLLVGAGVYLADAPRAPLAAPKPTAPELMTLVREAAALLERRGEAAYPELRTKGSKWFRDDTYFIVWALDGTRVFHAADPSLEGKQASDAADVLGRPYGRMFLEAAQGPSGEGWVHYMYPEPGDLFPTWKSTFVKRIRFPSGKPHLLGAGIYNMQMDASFIEDVVDRAVTLVAEKGKAAFDALRDPKGPFLFMDTYVFVDAPDGTELVNPAQPSLEGTNVRDLRDAEGKPLAREYIAAALEQGSAWVGYTWYRPGENTPARKRTYVRRVQSGDGTYVVGSGFYVEE